LQSIKIDFDHGKCDKKIVLVDKLRVQQILINLIQNAIKFSKAKKTITVRVKSIALANGQLKV